MYKNKLFGFFARAKKSHYSIVKEHHNQTRHLADWALKLDADH